MKTDKTETGTIDDVSAEKFLEITAEVIRAGAGYNDVHPTIAKMFADTMMAFTDLVQDQQTAEDEGLSPLDLKFNIFARVFDFDLKDYIDKIIEDATNQAPEDNSDTDINNVDEDVLANIKMNIDSYKE